MQTTRVLHFNAAATLKCIGTCVVVVDCSCACPVAVSVAIATHFKPLLDIEGVLKSRKFVRFTFGKRRGSGACKRPTQTFRTTPGHN